MRLWNRHFIFHLPSVLAPKISSWYRKERAFQPLWGKSNAKKGFWCRCFACNHSYKNWRYYSALKSMQYAYLSAKTLIRKCRGYWMDFGPFLCFKSHSIKSPCVFDLIPEWQVWAPKSLIIRSYFRFTLENKWFPTPSPFKYEPW